jgi:molecular chaperone HtpG
MEKYSFSAEIGKVLNLMIHSLYTNKDIFLRELISNASDACDKLRYMAIEDSKIMTNDEPLKIKVIIGKDTLTIKDNGIGMNKEDLIQCLGTIASSGTQKFLEAIQDQKSSPDLIGQFGVGFYSAFMVADEVVVKTRKAGEKKAYIWSSKGQGDYEIAELKEKIENGCEISLKIKSKYVEYLEKFRLKHIITTYSDHIAFPIELIENESTEVVNTASALWMRPKKEVTEEQYKEFYHHVAHLPDSPWLRIHTKAEGAISYVSLLYIPSMKPFDLFHPDRKTRVKLYVRKVFITEEANIIPAYLRFIRGVVDSEDLPLNISRETLQHNAKIEKIRKSIVKKVLGELKQKAKEDMTEYQKFWNNFGEVLKEGLCEPAIEEKEQLLEVCRFHSSKSAETLTSLDEYIDRMQDGQNEIFYILGDNVEGLRNHPQLEGFKHRDIEVLLLPDHVDDFWVNVINTYKNKALMNVNSSMVNLNDIKPMPSNENEGQEPDQELLDFVKKVLGSNVKDVIVSNKLVDSPACIGVPLGAMSIRMERYLIEQKQLKAPAGKILEINPEHSIIKKIKASIESDEAKDLVHIIFDQACILEGEPIKDPVSFAKRMNKYLAASLAA